VAARPGERPLLVGHCLGAAGGPESALAGPSAFRPMVLTSRRWPSTGRWGGDEAIESLGVGLDR
jgi:hypothetical protein